MTPMKNKLLIILAVVTLAMPLAIQAEDSKKPDTWLPGLQTETPQQGFELAIKLARMGVKSTQPDMETLHRERAIYSERGTALIHASEVIALHFQTVAAANNYWR